MAKNIQEIITDINNIFNATGSAISGVQLYENFDSNVLKKSFGTLINDNFDSPYETGSVAYEFSKATPAQKITIQQKIADTAYENFNSKFKARTGYYYSKNFTYRNRALEGDEVKYKDARVSDDKGWFDTIKKLAEKDKQGDYKKSKYWTGFAEKDTNAADYKKKINDAFNLVLFKKYAEKHKGKTLDNLISAKQEIFHEEVKRKVGSIITKDGKFFIRKAASKNGLQNVLSEIHEELCVIDAMINLKQNGLFGDNQNYDKITSNKTIKFLPGSDYYIKELEVRIDDSRLGADSTLNFSTVYYLGKNAVRINNDDYLQIAAVDPRKKVVSSVAPTAGSRGAQGGGTRGGAGVTGAPVGSKAAAIVRYNLARPVKDSRTENLQTNILRLADGTDGTLAGTIKGKNGFSRADLVDGKYSRITQIAVLSSLTQLRTEILDLIDKTEPDTPPAPPIVNEKRIIKLAKLLENKLLGGSTNLLLEEEKVSRKELIEFAKNLKDLEIKFKRQGGDLNQNINQKEYKKDRFVDVSLVDEYNSILSNLVIKDRKIDYAASINKIKAAEVKAAEDKTAAGAKGAGDAAGKKSLSVAPSQPYEVQCFNAKGTGSGESEMWEIDEAWSTSNNKAMKFGAWYDLAMEIFNHNPEDQSFDYKRGRKGKYEAYLLSIDRYRVAGDTLNVKCLPKFISPFVLQLFNDFIRARRMARKFEKAGNIKDLNQLKQDAKFFYSEDGKFESTFAYKVYKIGMDVVSFKNIEYLTQRQEKASKEDPNIPPPGAKGIKDARTTELIDKKLDARLKALQRAENIGKSRKSVENGKLDPKSLPAQTMFDNKKYKLFTGQ